VVDYYRTDYEEHDCDEGDQGDHYAFVQSVRRAGGKAVFGAEI
jgi:hypothetical protein